MDSTYKPFRLGGPIFKLTVFCYWDGRQKKKVKAGSSHFMKFLLASLTNITFGFAQHRSRPFTKPKEPFFANA